jgi:uncharacterized membrane protein
MGERNEPVFLDAVLRPNPPMRPAFLRGTLLLVAAINVAFASMFVLRGAWPIAPFMGADVALLAWAFHASRVAARMYEHVTLTASRLFVAHHSPRGQVQETSLNPYWVQVRLGQPADMPRRLTLLSHGKAVQVGNFLGPRERLSFAQALQAALNAARNSRPI